jgi:tetratricopeptide (TPR) repeat protein
LFTGCAASGVLSLGSKEISATLPFFIFLYEWYFFQDLNWSWLRRRLFLFVVLFTFLAAVALVYLGADPVERVLSSYAARDFTLTQRVLTQFRVVIFYLSLLLFPHPSRLNLDHDFFLSQSLLNPVTTILSIGAIVGLVVLAIYLARRERLLSFCILWFLGNLVIESSVIGLEIVFEHRTYLPSMLVSVVAVSLAYRLIKHRWLGVAVVCSVAVVFSFWTYARNSVWSDEVVLWQDCVKKSPQKARPHNNLGFALMEQGKIDEVIGHYRQALRIKPDYAEAHNNLGHALIERDEFDKGISHFSEGLRLECELKDRLMARGMLDKVARNPHKALRSEPDLKDLLNSLGVARFKEGKIKEAASYYRAALRIKPDYAAAHYNLGLALAAQGKLDEAISHYSEALRLDPDFAQVHNNLGIALFKKGDLEGAVVNFREALRIKPDFAKASRNLQVALERQRKSQGYAAKSQKASELQSGDPVLHYKLGNF